MEQAAALKGYAACGFLPEMGCYYDHAKFAKGRALYVYCAYPHLDIYL